MGILSWLIRNPALIAFALMTLGLAVTTAYARHERGRADELSVQLQIVQATLETTLKNQEIANEVSKTYQDRLAAVNRKLNAARMRRPTCLRVENHGPAGHSPISSGGVVSGPDSGRGISSDWLLDFGAEAERVRLQLLGCQKFIKEAQ